MKLFWTFAAALLLSLPLRAQDYHFSQFFANPLSLNPSMIGLFPGRYRVNFAHRAQWAQTLETPYQTTAFSADFHYYVNPKRRRYRDAFGVGVIFVSDRMPEFNYSVNQIMLGGAFHKSLDPKSNQYLSLGAQFGVVQRNVSYDRLTFDDAFDGTSTFVQGATGEVFPINNYAFGDWHLGLNYGYAPKNRTSVAVGVAMHHVGTPEQSFYNELTADEEFVVTNLLPRRYSGYLNLGVPLSRDVLLSPRVYAFVQGPHGLLNAGTNVRFLVNDTNGAALHLGAYGRVVNNVSGYGFDSAVAMLGVELNNFLVGVSYDVGLNGLQTARRHQGAFELNIAYLGKSDADEAVPCPRF